MSCFGGRVSQDLYQNCCNANTICEFNGDIDSLKSEPINMSIIRKKKAGLKGPASITISTLEMYFAQRSYPP